MNLTALILTTALVTGGDPCGAPCAAPAPCATAAPCGCDSPGFFVKLRAKLSSQSCVPCGTPLFAGFTTTCHEPKDACDKPGLLTRLKAKFQKVETCGAKTDCCAPSVTCSTATPVAGGCSLPVAPAPAQTAPEAPKAMPKPIETAPKPMPKKLETSTEILIPSIK